LVVSRLDERFAQPAAMPVGLVLWLFWRLSRD
jgi:hypothetical protein